MLAATDQSLLSEKELISYSIHACCL